MRVSTEMTVKPLPLGRKRLCDVMNASPDVIQIGDVADALGFSRDEASKLLSRWTEQGWMRRVAAGVYVPAPIEFQDLPYVLPDPWILIPALYGDSYIGGFSAAHYWELTDQLFQVTCVFTTKPVLKMLQVRHGVRFKVHHIGKEKLFGTKSLLRGEQTRVQITDIHRTIVDILSDPEMGAGMQHAAQCLWEYFMHDDRDDQALLRQAERLGNGAVFKRLGFMSEFLNQGDVLVPACKERLTTGYAKIDPLMECPRLLTKWRLWVPDDLRMYEPNDH